MPPGVMEIFNTIGIITALFMLSAFFSGSEAAIFSLGQARLKKLEDAGFRSARYIAYLLNDPEKLLITIIFANLLVNTLLSSLATVISIDLSHRFKLSEECGVLIGTFIVSYLLILIGEVTPINLAMNFSENFSRIASYPIYFMTFIFSRIVPLVPFIKKITHVIMPLFGVESHQSVTEQELKSAISIGEKEGMIEPHEKTMIHSIFEFGNTITKEAMTPRIDMICVKSDCTIESAFRAFKESGYSRLPVYETTLDNIIGIVHAKDLLAYMSARGGRDKNVSVKTILRQAYFVPETKNIDSLLKELQQHKVQMAIVVDEYGGTEGLITMEDIIEEIFGEILDEHDEEEKLFEKLDIYTYKVDPKISISDFNQLMETDVPEELFDTLGGLLFDLLGHVPYIGEEVRFENINFKIIQVEGKRIKKVFVKKLPEVNSEELIDIESSNEG